MSESLASKSVRGSNAAPQLAAAQIQAPAQPTERRRGAFLHKYFYWLLGHYLKLYIRPNDSVVEINPQAPYLAKQFERYHVLNLHTRHQGPTGAMPTTTLAEILQHPPNYLLLNGNIHYERDLQEFLGLLHKSVSPETRVVVIYYSALWRPLINAATRLGKRNRTREQNWISHEDIANLFNLADFEIVRLDNKILLPVYLPLLSAFVNRYLAPLPFFRWFTMVNIAIARPYCAASPGAVKELSVSIVVPARNESGNIEGILARCPMMGSSVELIFIEGNSTDRTWETICEATKKYSGPLKIITGRQDGKGKGDAVRKGFSLATNEVLMILDADLTVPPEDLPKFYDAISKNKGEFINGSRLVYPMEKQAMQFFNILGNKFFAIAFSFILGQRFKDTLCGTKVLSRANYAKLAAHRRYFGDFDPFGDFDLIFGAARLGLKITEIPVRYRERTYGETNIHRWRHGAILFHMLLFAARKVKFI
jgi:hypothetical protein